MQLIFGFLTLIYLKAICELIFNDGIGVLAAAIIAIAYAYMMLVAQLSVSLKIDRQRLRLAANPLGHAGLVALHFAVATALCVGISMLVVFGFSGDLAYEIFERRGVENLIWFSSVASVPGTVSGVLFYFWSRATLTSSYRG